MTDLEMWSLLVGFFLPPAIAVIQQKSWSDSMRALVAFACCIAAALGTCYFNGSLDGRSIISAMLTVLVTAVATYKAFWHKTGISDAIERLTSRKTKA
ncbi:hypothetical protein M1N87_02890 [Dehalococcoidia bacterium]|nr:hypothetical protein [Dehalococcoidia bacterium]MCL0088740.1 hypothetical protein [Dehalococcoidia bacterium]